MNRTAVRFQRGTPLADLGSLIELSILYFSGTRKRFAAFVFLIFPQKRKKAQNIGVYQATIGPLYKEGTAAAGGWGSLENFSP